MTRQVRLDDDVVDLVDALSDGLSLSGTTNRLLRSLLAGPARIDPGPARIAQDRRGRPGAPIDRLSVPGSPSATTERLVEAAGPEPAPRIAPDGRVGRSASSDQTSPPGRSGVTRVRRAKRLHGRSCPHPPARAVGNRCGVCGEPLS